MHIAGATSSEPRLVRGLLITIEGLDGAGKSTLADALHAELVGRGLPVELMREPGGVPLAERIRALVKDRSPAQPVSPRAETLLYAAARAQLIATAVAPLLERGTWVLLDRFVDSSLAYQGGGRALGVAQVRAVNAFATGGLAADRTLLLELSPASCRARQRDRGAAADRIEREGERFFTAVAATYGELARGEPRRIRTIAAERPRDEVLRDALAAIDDLLPASARGAIAAGRS